MKNPLRFSVALLAFTVLSSPVHAACKSVTLPGGMVIQKENCVDGDGGPKSLNVQAQPASPGNPYNRVQIQKNYSVDGVKKDLSVQTNPGYLKVNLSNDVLFDFSSYTVNAKAAEKLDQLAYLASQTRKGQIVIRGNTDSIGTREANNALSHKRAYAVSSYLQSHGGPANTYYTLQGLGEDYPVAMNENADGSDNPAGRAKNRRVEIYIQTVENAAIPAPTAAYQVAPKPLSTHSSTIQGNGKTVHQSGDGSLYLQNQRGSGGIQRNPDGSFKIFKAQ